MVKKISVTRSIIPIGDKVLLKELKEDNKSKSGIVLLDTVSVNNGLRQGKVIAVGEGKYIETDLIELSIKKGDTVLFNSGEKITFDGEDYVLVRESEISAKIDIK